MAGQFTDEQLEALRQANDIVEVIGAQVQLKRRGREYVGLCPFHNDISARNNFKCTKFWAIIQCCARAG